MGRVLSKSAARKLILQTSSSRKNAGTPGATPSTPKNMIWSILDEINYVISYKMLAAGNDC